jgi:hypothetical protein
MAVICNVKTEARPTGPTESYDQSEKYIESGSAYFAQAFAEALGLTSDLELHDLYRAELRLRSMDVLLAHALKEYDGALELYEQTGLFDYHERKLREAGLDLEGTRHVLREAGNRDFLLISEQLIESVAVAFDQVGYQGLMSLYLDKVHNIHHLVGSPSVTLEPGTANGVAWQELGWKLTTLFTQAAQIGQAIAVLNTFTGRLSVESRQL